jgi:hypothetical protein
MFQSRHYIGGVQGNNEVIKAVEQCLEKSSEDENERLCLTESAHNSNWGILSLGNATSFSRYLNIQNL